MACRRGFREPEATIASKNAGVKVMNSLIDYLQSIAIATFRFERRHLLDKQDGVPYHAMERYVLFSGGFTEVGFILFIAFLLFGPKKLPEIARILGKGMGELRRASNELKNSLEEEIRNLDHQDEEVTYSEQETHPYTYTETEEENYEHPEEVTHELSDQSEGALEPTPEYGYDYSESPQREPEPRPRG
jgi:TatA/E family protein of Tat protein translocase